MTIDKLTPPARPMQMETSAADTTKPVTQQPVRSARDDTNFCAHPTDLQSSEPRPTATVDTLSTDASLRGGNLSLGCHCCDGTCSFYKSCC